MSEECVYDSTSSSMIDAGYRADATSADGHWDQSILAAHGPSHELITLAGLESLILGDCTSLEEQVSLKSTESPATPYIV